MALRRLAVLKYTKTNNIYPLRWTHSLAKPSLPLDIFPNTLLPMQFILPESDPRAFPSLPSYGGRGSGSMDLMAVPRKKVTYYIVCVSIIFYFIYSIFLFEIIILIDFVYK